MDLDFFHSWVLFFSFMMLSMLESRKGLKWSNSMSIYFKNDLRLTGKKYTPRKRKKIILHFLFVNKRGIISLCIS